MNPALLIPKAGTIPAHWMLFEALDILAFAVHIALMNIVAGGCMMALAARLRASDRPQEDVSGVVRMLPVVLALAINFGVAPLLFVQVLYGHLLYTSSILMGVYWMLVIPLLLAAYYGLYAFRRVMTSPGRGPTILVLGVTAVLLAIAFIFVNNMSLMTQPEKWKAFFAHRRGTFLNLSDPALLPRLLHFLVASTAVTGLFSAGLSFYRRGDTGGSEDGVRRGLCLFAYAGIVQAAVGTWYTAALPEKIMAGFLGGSILHTAVYAAGIAAGVASVVYALRGDFKKTLVHFALTMLMMSATRAALRSAQLADSFRPSSLQTEPQHAALILFVAVLAAVLFAIRWMLGLAGTRRAEGRPAK